MKNLVSIIVPIYGVEKYLAKCIESIMNQTYTNIEIILVDDGSKDLCPQICDEFQKKDTRIKVIHKKNGGLSDARNVGISKATGDYISLIDSDDFVSPTFIEDLLILLTKENCDIAICDYYMFSNQDFKGTNTVSTNGCNYFNGKKEIMNNFFNKRCGKTVVAWNKLYKRELFNNVYYPVGKNYEDEATTYKLFYNAKKVGYLDKQLYYYLQREESIMGQKMGMKNLVAFDSLDSVVKFYENSNDNYLAKKAKVRFFKTLILYKINAKKQYKLSNDIESLEVLTILDRIYKEKMYEYGISYYRPYLTVYKCIKSCLK